MNAFIHSLILKEREISGFEHVEVGEDFQEQVKTQ